MMQQAASKSALANASAPTHHRARSSGGLGEHVPPFSPTTPPKSASTDFPKPRASLPSTLPLESVASAPQFLEPETSKPGFFHQVARQPSVSDDSGDEEAGKPARPPPAPSTPSKSDISSSFWGAASSVRFMVKETIQTLKGEQRRDLTRTKADFKAIMKDSSVQDIVVRVKTFINWMLQQDDFTPQEQVDQIQRFMQDITQRVVRHPTFKGAPVDELEWVIDGMERHILNKLYRSLFANEADRKRDEYLQDKMEGLQWVTCPMLVGTECGIDETDANHELFDLARQELVKMNSKRPPMDKLQCVTSCCQAIQRALATMLTRPASADEFLPVLIYIVITANPPCLHSNLQYVQQYGKMSRLASGEEGYYFTNLCGAVSFLENMDHTHMEMPKDVYDRKVTLQRLQSVGRDVSDCPTIEEIEHPLTGIVLDSATTITDVMIMADALRQSQAQLWGFMSRMQQDMKALGWQGPVTREASLGGVSVPHVDIPALSATPPGSTDALTEQTNPTETATHSSYADVVKRGDHPSDHENHHETPPQENEISGGKSPPAPPAPTQEPLDAKGSHCSDLMHSWANVPAVVLETPSNGMMEPPSPGPVVFGRDSVEDGLTDTDSTCSSASPWAQRARPKPRRRSRLSTSSLGSATEASEYFAGAPIEGESDDRLESIQSSGDGEDTSIYGKRTPQLPPTHATGDVADSGGDRERLEKTERAEGKVEREGGEVEEKVVGVAGNGEWRGGVDSSVPVASAEEMDDLQESQSLEGESTNLQTVSTQSSDSGDMNTEECVNTPSELVGEGHQANVDGLYGLHANSETVENTIHANTGVEETPSSNASTENEKTENTKNECVDLDSGVQSIGQSTEITEMTEMTEMTAPMGQNGDTDDPSVNGELAPTDGETVGKRDMEDVPSVEGGAETKGLVFTVQCSTQPGQTVVVTGSTHELEYKYALASDLSPNLTYENGPNRVFEGGMTLETNDVYGQPCG